MNWFKQKVVIAAGFILLLLGSLLIPPPDFIQDIPRSTLLQAEDSTWLSGIPSKEEQWCFQPQQRTPKKYYDALVCFEDQRFYTHFGVDFIALGRALVQNIKGNRIVSGASTLTMQLARIHYQSHRRNWFQKIRETHLALRTELYLSKAEILKSYSSVAPFGGNIIGIEAASIRYFGRLPYDLSWAEASMLAVLPNEPSVIYPGAASQKLKKKRNKLLGKLREKGIINQSTYALSVQEPVPEKWFPIPFQANHLLAQCVKEKPAQEVFQTSIDKNLQQSLAKIWALHSPYFTANGIHNGAILVLDVETGLVKAYGGNFADVYAKERTGFVDCIKSARSTGSILKPLLFAQILESGKLLPQSLVPDIPTIIAGYVPRNHDLTYEGAVPFRNAVYRSLNVPAVRLLQEYGIEKFHRNLRQMGMTTLHKPAVHYGLSLILGGAEGSLWDLCGIYASMARTLKHYNKSGGRYYLNDWHLPLIDPSDSLITFSSNNKTTDKPLLSASVIWHTLETMKEVFRPDMEAGWKNFPNAYNIAWKTGTSFGNRDGWSIGVTPRYVVGVWVGNAEGDGRPELTGIKAAAPILFDVFRQLPNTGWFEAPENDMSRVVICSKSGFRAAECCERKDTVMLTKKATNAPLCAYCKPIFVDKRTRKRVTGDCESIRNMVAQCAFVLPPTMAAYYAVNHATYTRLPEYRSDCAVNSLNKKQLEIIYPIYGSKIVIPKELDGQKGKMVAKAAHTSMKTTLYWHLDNEYLGLTTDFHHFPLEPLPGKHRITVTDPLGESDIVEFEVAE